MKIAILGTSGSGKSTLAKRLGERYGLPVLHMDTVHFLPGWVERPFAEEEAIVRQFLDETQAAGSSTAIIARPAMPVGWKKRIRSSCSGFRRWSASGGRYGVGSRTKAV